MLAGVCTGPTGEPQDSNHLPQAVSCSLSEDSDAGLKGLLKWGPAVWPLCSGARVTRDFFSFLTSSLGWSVRQRRLMCCFVPIKRPWQLSGQTHHASALFISPPMLLCLLGSAVERWQHIILSLFCVVWQHRNLIISSKETGYTTHCRVQFKQEKYEQLQPVDLQQGHCCSRSVTKEFSTFSAGILFSLAFGHCYVHS